MKTASFLIAALALSAGLAAAGGDASQQGDRGSSSRSSQVGRPAARESGGVRTDYGQDRRIKRGTVQGYNTGATGESVGKDQPATVTGADQPAAATAGQRRSDDSATRGTGVATGFVAAGIGLAIMGLFVRRRGRHDDLDDVGRDDDDYYGGSGTQTRM